MSEHELLLPQVTEENICLPLAVSAVSKYWNVNLPLSEAKEIAKKYPNMRGSILIEGIDLAERHGLGSLILHSSLISGYDEQEKTIIHYIPQQDQIGAIPEKQFEKLWEQDGNLAILLAPI